MYKKLKIINVLLSIALLLQLTQVVKMPVAYAEETDTITLTESGPVTVSSDNQVIENLLITADGTDAITVNGFNGVTIRNCEIRHKDAKGIYIENSDNVTIENVYVINVGAPESGKHTTGADDNVNIYALESDDLTITNARLEKGSSGIISEDSMRTHASFIEGYDFRGPFPRGQLFQFIRSDDGILEDFSAINPWNTSWTEDIVSVYQSSNCIIRRGLIDGNNAPTGVGVMFEQSDEESRGGLVEDVDTIHQMNGCFSAVPARDVTFRRVRARDNTKLDLGRGTPSSGGLAFAAYKEEETENLKIEDSYYYNLAAGKVWKESCFELIELEEQDFTPREPIELLFSWEDERPQRPAPVDMPTPTPKPTPVPGNLALDKSVTGSEDPGSPSNVTDGFADPDELTTIDTKSPQYITIDLGESYSNINRIRMWHYFPDGRIYHDVIVQFSNDEEFSEAVTVFNNDGDNSSGQGIGTDDEYAESADGKIIGFEPLTARYVRTWINGSSANGSNHWVEVEVFDTSTTYPEVPSSGDSQLPHRVSGKLPTTSANIGNPTRITDGEKDSSEFSHMDADGPQWISFDFGDSYDINRIRVWRYFDDGRSYRDVVIQLSNDEDFSEVVTVFNNDADNSAGQGVGTDSEYRETRYGKEITFEPVNARYIKLWSDGNSKNGGNHYVEVEVYDINDPTPEPMPSSIANLSSLELSSGSISPTVSADVYNYSATVAFDVSQITVNATAEDSKASISINDAEVESGVDSDPIDLVEGENLITIIITPEDESVTVTYTVTVTRESEFPDFNVSSPVFTDLAGTSLTELTANGFIRSTVNITSTSAEEKPATLIAALCDSTGNIKNISIIEKSLEAGETVNMSAGFNLPADVDGYYIKILVWDSLSGMQPLSSQVIFPAPQ